MTPNYLVFMVDSVDKSVDNLGMICGRIKQQKGHQYLLISLALYGSYMPHYFKQLSLFPILGDLSIYIPSMLMP